MNNLIKIGDFYAVRGKPAVCSTGNIYPITIGFGRDISDEAMQRLALYAYQLEHYDNEAQKEKQQKEE